HTRFARDWSSDVCSSDLAAAEAACHTGSSFSVLSLGDPGSTDCTKVITLIEVPGALGFLGTGEWGADMPGMSDLEPQYVDKYGADRTSVVEGKRRCGGGR